MRTNIEKRIYICVYVCMYVHMYDYIWSMGAFSRPNKVYEKIFNIKMAFFAQHSCMANIYSTRWAIFIFYSYSRTHGTRFWILGGRFSFTEPRYICKCSGMWSVISNLRHISKSE